LKQAILVTAYKNYEHLEKIIQFFEDDSFEIYVHVDKKSFISNAELDNLKRYKSLQLITQKYKVNWGGFNHLKSILYLVNKALLNSDIVYFHLITGHDFPIKSLDYFKNFTQSNGKKEQLEFFQVPRESWANNGGMDRLEYFNFFDLFDYKNHKQRNWLFKITAFQKKINLKRKLPANMPKLYGGSTYWSLSRASLEYVSEYTQKNKWVLNRFKFTLCAEEFYFQTILMNSFFANSVVNNNLRYIDWNARNGNNPAILDESDYEKLVSSEALFARKFEFPISKILITKLSDFLKKEIM
jgi:hypothetical protein